MDHEQNGGNCSRVFIADGFVAILHKANRKVAIHARVLLFCAKTSESTPLSAESPKPGGAAGGAEIRLDFFQRRRKPWKSGCPGHFLGFFFGGSSFRWGSRHSERILLMSIFRARA